MTRDAKRREVYMSKLSKDAAKAAIRGAITPLILEAEARLDGLRAAMKISLEQVDARDVEPEQPK